MPVTKSFQPQRQYELIRKLRANKPGQEAQLLKDVKDHIKGGSAIYIQSPDGTIDVGLMAEKCIVYVIVGKFSIGGKDYYDGGKAHVVENETRIQLQQGTAVVIINAALPLSTVWKIIPQFQSRSIPSTLHFYMNELGFKGGSAKGQQGAEPSAESFFCSLFIGNKAEANIYFFKCDEKDFHPSRAMIALGTEELDEFYEHVKGNRAVEVVEPVEDKEWGYRQFAVKDIDGNVLTFFRFLKGGNPGSD